MAWIRLIRNIYRIKGRRGLVTEGKEGVKKEKINRIQIKILRKGKTRSEYTNRKREEGIRMMKKKEGINSSQTEYK